MVSFSLMLVAVITVTRLTRGYEELFGSIADSSSMNNTILFYNEMNDINDWNFRSWNSSEKSYVKISNNNSLCVNTAKPCLIVDCDTNDICHLALKSNIKIPTSREIWMQYSFKYLSEISDTAYNKIVVRYHCNTTIDDFDRGNIYNSDYPYNWRYSEPSPAYNNKTINLNHRIYGCSTNDQKIFIDIFGITYNLSYNWIIPTSESIKISIQDIYIFEPSTIPLRLNTNSSNSHLYINPMGRVEVLFDKRWGGIISTSSDLADLMCRSSGYLDASSVYTGVSGLFPDVPDMVWMQNIQTWSPVNCTINGPLYCNFDGWGVISSKSVQTLGYLNVICNIPSPTATPTGITLPPTSSLQTSSSTSTCPVLPSFSTLGCCDDLPSAFYMRCYFYKRCVAEYNQCNDINVSSVAVDNEFFICQEIRTTNNDYDILSEEAMNWWDNTSFCLMQNIMDMVLYSDELYSCHLFDEFAYNMHFECYLNADYLFNTSSSATMLSNNISICKINNSSDWDILFSIFEYIDQRIEWRMTKAMYYAVKECVSNLGYLYFNNKIVYRYRAGISVDFNAVYNLYNGTGINVMNWADSAIKQRLFMTVDQFIHIIDVQNSSNSIVYVDFIFITNETKDVTDLIEEGCNHIKYQDEYTSWILGMDYYDIVYSLTNLVMIQGTNETLCHITTPAPTTPEITDYIDEAAAVTSKIPFLNVLVLTLWLYR